MQASSSKRIRRGKAFRLGLALLTSGLALLALSAAAHSAQAIGVACTTSASPNPTFTLDATDGYIQLPDGNTMYMWGYAMGGGAFQHPGPVLCVNQGDTVTVILNNYAAQGRVDHVPWAGERAGQRRAGAAAVRWRDAHLADQCRAGKRRQRHLQLRGLQARQLHLRERHGAAEAGAHGPVRCADRAADAWAPISSTTAPTAGTRWR